MSALWPLLQFCVACSGPGAHEQARSPAPIPDPAVPPASTAPPRNPPLATPEASRTQSLVLAAAGDVNLGRVCGQRLLADASYDPLRGVAPIWANADLRFVNLESALSEQHGETQSPHHGLVFTGPPVGADALARAGIGIVSTANNHAWDYASRGLLETIQNLDRAGVAHVGTGADEADAYRPAVVRVNGLSVAFFAVTQIWNLGVFREEEARHHVAWADFSRLREALVKARAESDFVIVSYHGGEEYTDVPLPKTRAFVAEVMSLGVDVVIGHHPHVPQGVAWYGARPVFYSLGNFVFDGRANLPWTRASFIAKLRFQRGQAVSVAACPVLIEGFEPRALTPNDEPSRRAFERHLRGVSDSVGGTSFGEPDAQGCYALTPPSPSAPTPLRDRPRADRESVPLARR
jgi:poly-gamma-glutamate capsule biosynthesis protein CapA/YwtB (metallophosphatase superfamily)